jgi:hypothetical protein
MFTACVNDDTAFDGTADVFILAKTTDQGTTYAPAYYMYGNLKMKTVEVTPPGAAQSIELENFNNLDYTFYLEPSDEDYVFNIPTLGNYSFEVQTQKDVQAQFTDQLETNVIDAPTLSGLTMQNYLVTLTWNEVPDADAYIVQLLDETGENYFYGSDFLVGQTSITLSEEDISDQSSEQPQTGQKCILRMKSFLFEENTSSDHGMNIQCVNTLDTTFTWQ